MRTSSFEDNPVPAYLIDQQPVRLDMALSTSLVIAYELMVTVNWIGLLTCQKRADNDLKFAKILSPLLDPLDVL